MRALSITEPYATLIKDGVKKIETRSWKTNYRGELYIHASLTKVSKNDRDNDELMSLVSSELSFGNIVCKCNLVDCVYMTKEFILDIKKNNYQEYICGEYKEGRYAWILEDVLVVDPITIKGKLGIWNFEL